MRAVQSIAAQVLAVASITLAFPVVAFSKQSPQVHVNNLDTLVTNIASLASGKTLAVMPLREFDNVTTPEGRRIGEEIKARLSSAIGLTLATRDADLQDVFGELKLDETGHVDPKTVKALNKLVGVDMLVTGYIARDRSSATAYCNLIEVERGRLVRGWILQLRAPTRSTTRPLFAAGYSWVALNPRFPSELTTHQNHVDDAAFLLEFAGATPLNRVTVHVVGLEAGVTHRRHGSRIGVVGAYLLKFPLSHSGRAEIQQVNDFRDASIGSFIYTQVADLSPGHALRTGVSWFTGPAEHPRIEVEGLFDLGVWNMTVEKGWARFGRDQAEAIARASGLEMTPSGRFRVNGRLLALHLTAGLPTIRYSYDAESRFGSHRASGASLAVGITMRPRLQVTGN